MLIPDSQWYGLLMLTSRLATQHHSLLKIGTRNHKAPSDTFIMTHCFEQPYASLPHFLCSERPRYLGQRNKKGKEARLRCHSTRLALLLLNAPGVDPNVVLAIADRLGHRLPRVDLVLPKDTTCRAELPAPKPNNPSTDLLKPPNTCQAIQA